MSTAIPQWTETDDLEDFIAEQTARNPDFPKLMEEASRRHELRSRGGGQEREDQHDVMGERASDVMAERAAEDPESPALMREAAERRRLLAALTEARHEAGLSQTQVAARMRTSASAVARLEAGEIDPKLSTLCRYAAAIGTRLRWGLGED